MQQPMDIPVYIEANSKDELIKLMLNNNVKRGAYFPYQIMKDGKKWVAWYFLNVENEVFKGLDGK